MQKLILPKSIEHIAKQQVQLILILHPQQEEGVYLGFEFFAGLDIVVIQIFSDLPSLARHILVLPLQRCKSALRFLF